MSKFKNFVLGAATVASMVACSPKVNDKQESRENTKKDLIETIVAGETEEDVLHIKNFNQAIINHDMEGALYNLASAYENRCKYMRRDESLGRLEDNAYGLLPEIKEFSNRFGKDPKLQEIKEMADHGEFGIGNNTPGSNIITIINRVTSLNEEESK